MTFKRCVKRVAQHTKSLVLPSLFLAFLTVFWPVPQAYAQSFSAGSFNAADSGQTVRACRTEALTLSQRLLTVRQIIDTIINCNENGQVYNRATDTCVTPVLSPDHIFTPSATGDTLALENPDGSFGTDVVLGGVSGADVTCEPDTSGGSTPSSPPPRTPASCTAPNGDIFAHGSCVTRYSRSVANNCAGFSVTGASCIHCSQFEENFCCNDGSLSNVGLWSSYSHATCSNICAGGLSCH